MAPQGYGFEFVFVDDHSTDATPAILKRWGDQGAPLRYVRLARNCGSFNAMAAGLRLCTGDAAVIMAADLQDPPEVIPELAAEWKAGHDVVLATRLQREGETLSTKTFASVYYWLMRRFAMPEIPAGGADFLLVGRNVIDAYNAIPERNTSFLATIIWLGFRRTSLGYVKQARHAGHSKWSFSRKIKLFIDSFVSFSYLPIRVMSLLGVLMATCGFAYALLVIGLRLTGVIEGGTGFAALMTVVLIGQGTIMVMLGVLGEYLWRCYDEVRGRPRYVVEEYVHAADAATETSAWKSTGRAA